MTSRLLVVRSAFQGRVGTDVDEILTQSLIKLSSKVPSYARFIRCLNTIQIERFHHESYLRSWAVRYSLMLRRCRIWRLLIQTDLSDD